MNRARLSFLSLCAAVVSLAACQSYQTSQEISEAQGRIERGNTRAARDLVENINDVPPGLRPQAIDAIAQAPGSTGETGLSTVVQNPGLSQAHRQQALERLSQRDSDSARTETRRLLEREPALLSPTMIAAMAAQKDAAAVPLLRRAAEERAELMPPVLDALATIGDASGQEFVLAQALNPDQRIRAHAIRAMSGINNPPLQTQAAVIYEGLVRTPNDQSKETLQLAIDQLGRHGQAESAFPAVKDLYDSTTDPDIKQSALEAMARLRGISPEQMIASLNPQRRPSALEDGAASLEYLRELERRRQQIQRESTSRRVETPVATGRRPRSYPADYRDRLNRAMAQALGDDARLVAQQIHNALLAYRQSDAPSSEFVLRSYRKQFDGSDAEQRTRLEQGLNLPGSLSIVVWNVIEEYPTDALRTYALAELFAIKRWQATILIDLVRRSRI